ncbi:MULTISPECIES: glycine betaine ABC transporter substrate-binding protein [unclassified Lysinibacillus]|uniref:glycine betaine ABC transporter substrate-binding protein n=1 Tax=unclassified Lysinibacillus TaxID=2636778 RepID=UPI0020117D7D|nr:MULTISPECIES: glycine betaine ABC transporter substrate-binding protein [unclassified Lysinibacillus]MCL1696696.1 glycine betaine ABC transporter substrate-binding protein [Lysinibacillus sp. BPa_S21]MCL1698823.1 glycine betaine ABC transporter substrate-binding protein [Lysinibacillus sp. Bpr_S20]
MKLKTLTKLGMALGLGLLLAACSGDDSSKSSGNSKDVNLAYVEWDTEIASTNVVGQVLEDLGYNVTLTPLDNAIMWEAVSKGEADGMVAAWLPNTHAPQYKKYKDDLDELGENLSGAKIGLVVPSYMDVNSIEDLKNQADKTITGIEPGAGITAATETAKDEYDNLADWNLLTSSSGAMTTSLAKAIKNKEDIVVTGWSPHWKFAKYDLKYLEDPKGIYGGEETINTFARKGLKEDQPDVYSVLDNFHWTSEDLENVMLEIMNGKDPKQAAKDWVKDNEDKVAEWTKDVKK